MQELQKERVRQQELKQKQQVPRDLTDYLWNLGLIWSKPHGTGIFDRILYSKVVPFQITIPVAHVTDVEFARSLDMFTDPHCGHATRRKKSRKRCSRTILASGARG